MVGRRKEIDEKISVIFSFLMLFLLFFAILIMVQLFIFKERGMSTYFDDRSMFHFLYGCAFGYLSYNYLDRITLGQANYVMVIYIFVNMCIMFITIVCQMN